MCRATVQYTPPEYKQSPEVFLVVSPTSSALTFIYSISKSSAAQPITTQISQCRKSEAILLCTSAKYQNVRVVDLNRPTFYVK
jgi:hypothetical protein